MVNEHVDPVTLTCSRCRLFYGVVDYYNMYDYLKLPKWKISAIRHDHDLLECPLCGATKYHKVK